MSSSLASNIVLSSGTPQILLAIVAAAGRLVVNFVGGGFCEEDAGGRNGVFKVDGIEGGAVDEP